MAGDSAVHIAYRIVRTILSAMADLIAGTIVWAVAEHIIRAMTRYAVVRMTRAIVCRSIWHIVRSTMGLVVG